MQIMSEAMNNRNELYFGFCLTSILTFCWSEVSSEVSVSLCLRSQSFKAFISSSIKRFNNFRYNSRVESFN